MLQNLEWSGNEDTWLWDLDQNGFFSVSSARKHIDSIMLHSGDRPTRWNNFVPIKVNILGWRINLDRLPTRKNLVDKGIDLSSLLCPMCGDHIEDVSHVFVRCEVACHTWEIIFRWFGISTPIFVLIDDIMDWVDSVQLSHNRRKILEAVMLTTMWVIWKFRNNKVFGDLKMKRSTIFDFIVANAFEWCSSRSKVCSKNWTLWLQNPMLCIM